MNFYLVTSGRKWPWTKSHTIIARSSLHAVQIAEECSVHKKGRAVVCLLIEQSSLPLDVRSLLRSGPGLVTFNRTHFVVVRKSM